jgi:hypothetical protein
MQVKTGLFKEQKVVKMGLYMRVTRFEVARRQIHLGEGEFSLTPDGTLLIELEKLGRGAGRPGGQAFSLLSICRQCIGDLQSCVLPETLGRSLIAGSRVHVTGTGKGSVRPACAMMEEHDSSGTIAARSYWLPKEHQRAKHDNEGTPKS